MTDYVELATFRTFDVAEIAHEKGDGRFFSEGNLRSFSTQVEKRLYGGHYFTSSAKTPNNPRLWTLYMFMPSGDVEPIGESMGYRSLALAVVDAHKLTEAEKTVQVRLIDGMTKRSCRYSTLGRECGDMAFADFNNVPACNRHYVIMLLQVAGSRV